MPHNFDVSVVKFNFWIYRASSMIVIVFDVKVDPNLLIAYSSPPKQISFNFFIASVLIFILSFKDPL